MKLYYLLKVVLRPIFKLLFNLNAENLDELPSEGKFIIAANHKSYLDPLIIGILVPRPVFFIAKDELFRIPVFSRLIKVLGAFPVKRDGRDISALRKALMLLNEKNIIGIFVEGRRIRNKKIGEIKPGIYLLAKTSKAPVVITCIHGVKPLWKKMGPIKIPNRISVKFKNIGIMTGNTKKEEYLTLIKDNLDELWTKLEERKE